MTVSTLVATDEKCFQLSESMERIAQKVRGLSWWMQKVNYPVTVMYLLTAESSLDLHGTYYSIPVQFWGQCYFCRM